MNFPQTRANAGFQGKEAAQPLEPLPCSLSEHLYMLPPLCGDTHCSDALTETATGRGKTTAAHRSRAPPAGSPEFDTKRHMPLIRINPNRSDGGTAG